MVRTGPPYHVTGAVNLVIVGAIKTQNWSDPPSLCALFIKAMFDNGVCMVTIRVNIVWIFLSSVKRWFYPPFFFSKKRSDSSTSLNQSDLGLRLPRSWKDAEPLWVTSKKGQESKSLSEWIRSKGAWKGGTERMGMVENLLLNFFFKASITDFQCNPPWLFGFSCSDFGFGSCSVSIFGFSSVSPLFVSA